jgi:hypothetical protein
MRGNSIPQLVIESNRCIGVLGVLSRLRGLGVRVELDELDELDT